jgi:hypothetical protein
MAINGRPNVVEVVQAPADSAQATFNAEPGDKAFWTSTTDGSTIATDRVKVASGMAPYVCERFQCCIVAGNSRHDYPERVLPEVGAYRS